MHAVRLLSSADTGAHVDAVRRASAFWREFEDWDPAARAPLDVDAVSGSTLTSLAMVEGVERRISGRLHSHRFARPVDLQEARALFPGAALLTPEEDGRLRVADPVGEHLGWLLRTSPEAENLRGYRGPTEALLAVAAEGSRIRGLRLRASYDTGEYVERVAGAQAFLDRLADIPLADWPEIDFAAAGIEGVSGATQTSFAVAEGIRRRLVADRAGVAPAGPWASSSRGSLHELLLLAIVAGSIVMTFGPWRARRGLRRAWQIVLVAGLGLALGDLLSIALLAGWSRNGAPASTAPVLCLLVAVGLLAPWGTRRQLYCHALCPHGALQEWGRRPCACFAGPCRAGSTADCACFRACCSPAGSCSRPGGPRSISGGSSPSTPGCSAVGALVSAGLAVVGLVACLFVPLAYCRFGCPTGALLEFLRGSPQRLSRTDALGGLLVLSVAAVTLFAPPSDSARRAASAAPMGGRAFGTSWSLKLRGAPPTSTDWARTRLRGARAHRGAPVVLADRNSEISQFQTPARPACRSSSRRRPWSWSTSACGSARRAAVPST